MKKEHPLRYMTVFLCVTLFYFLIAKASLTLASLYQSASPMWLPTGIAVAALLVLGIKYWPSIFVGAFAVNFFLTPSPLVLAGIALGNSCEAIVGAFLIARFARGVGAFDSLNSMWHFFAIAFTVPLISALFGPLSLFYGGFLASTSLYGVIFTWWIGNVIGLLLVAPLVIVFYENKIWAFGKNRIPELFLALLSFMLVSFIVFFGWPLQLPAVFMLPFWIIPSLLWIAFRFCLRVLTSALLIFALIATAGTTLGFGLFNTLYTSFNTSLITLQLFTISLIVTVLPVGVAVLSYKRMLLLPLKRRSLS